MSKVSIRQERLDRGGYTSRGQYFGVGPTLYVVQVDGEDVGHVRAKGNFESRASVLQRVKDAVQKHGSKAHYRW